MRDKKIYLLYPNCGYCVYYMIQYQYKVISKKYKKEAVFLGKVLEYSLFFVLFWFHYRYIASCRVQVYLYRLPCFDRNGLFDDICRILAI